MTINEADNVMYGDTEVSKVYCGDALVWERGGGRVVPAGYEELEYYRNYDTNYAYACNTEFRPQSGTLKFECKVAPHQFGDKVFIGGYLSDPFAYADLSTFQVMEYYGQKARLGQIFTDETGRVGRYLTTGNDTFPVDAPAILSGTFSSGFQELILNGVPYQQNLGYAVLPRDVWIGSNGSYATASLITIYYIKLFDGDTLARDMVPVQRESDGAYGLWDFVTQSFYEFRR